MKERRITLFVNEERYEVTVPVNKTLLHALREDLGLTDTKCDCGGRAAPHFDHC